MKFIFHRWLLPILFGAVAILVVFVIGWRQGARNLETERAIVAISPQRRTISAASGIPNVEMLSRVETDQRLAAILAAGNGPSRTKSRDIAYLLDHINPADIPDVVAQLGRSPANTDASRLMQNLIIRYSRTDASGALALAAKLADPRRRDDTIAQVVSGLISHNPQLALLQLASIPPGKTAQKSYEQAFESWARDGNSAMAAGVAAKLPDGAGRASALKGVAEFWPSQDPPAALNWAAGLPSADAAVFTDVVLTASGSNPRLAAQYLDKLPDASARNQAIGAIAANIAHGNPVAALTWLDDVATGATYDNAVTGILANAVRRDPAQAAALMEQVTEPGVREAAIANLAKNWGAADPAAALNWVQSLPDSDATVRDAAWQTVIGSWGKNDPKAAINFIEQSANPSFFLPAIPALVQTWAASEPQAALAWTNSLPEGSAKNQALGNVLAVMAKADFTATWNYAAQLPASAARDTALASLVDVQAKKDPEKAVVLLGQFPQGPAQLDATRSVAAVWVLQDTPAFTQWAATLPADGQREAAIAAALSAARIAKLSEIQRTALIQKLNEFQ